MSTPISRPDHIVAVPEPIYESVASVEPIDVDSYLRAINQRFAELAEIDTQQLEKRLPTVTIDDGRKLERDEKNLVSRIVYPGGDKTREVTKTDASGQAIELVTKDSEGKSTIVNRDGKWFAKFQGLEMPLPGGVRFDRRTGDFMFELGTPGLWQREKADGTVSQEKENADGSIVSLNAQGGVGTITRRDNSSVTQTDAGTIVETISGGKSVEWKLQGTDWICTQNPQLHRKNFRLDTNGVVSYDTPEGDNFRVGGDGSVSTQGPGKAKLTFDEHNRVIRIEWPNGNQTRDFTYFGDSKDIKTVTVTDKQRGTTYINERPDAKSNRWEVRNTQGQRVDTWFGQVMLSASNAYSRRYTDSQGNSRDNKWHTLWTDGTETRDSIDDRGNRTAYDSRGRVRFKESEDGSRATYDDAGKVRYVRTAAGSTYDVSDSQIRMFNNHTGEAVTFTNSGGKWTSDSKNYPGERLALTVTEQGELSFNTGGDKKYLQKTDGTLAVIGKDNVRVDFLNGEVSGITKGDHHRSFVRENGQVVKVIDADKTGQKVLFDAAVQTNVTNVHINSEGDFSYATPKGAVIERANFSHLELDQKGNITIARAANGSSRELKYIEVGDKSELAQVIDRKASGEIKEVWTRQINADNTLTNRFLAAPAPGSAKPRVRENLNVCRDGELEYNNPGDAKIKVAKLGVTIDGADGWLSESVDDARSRLMEVMAGQVDESRRVRMEKMMLEFEKRMADRAYLETLGGRDQAKVEETTQQKVSQTYDHLAALISSEQPGAYYDPAMRVKLAENFMFHAQDPSTMDQGANGTCWMQAGHIAGGLVNHPDCMARLLREASWGRFRTLNGGERGGGPQDYTFSRRTLAMGGEEQRWTINNALRGGSRSPVGMIFDETCSIMGGRRGPNGGNYGGSSGCRNIMFKVTGDIVADNSHFINGSERDTLLLNGAYVTYAPGHMRSRHIKRDGDGWVIIQDDQHGEGSDRVISRVRDIRQWIKENAGGTVRRNLWRSNQDDPFGPNPHYPGQDYPDGTDDPYWPGPCPDDDQDWRPRIRIRLPFLRRLFRRCR